MTFSTKNIFIIVVIATFWHAKESGDGCVCVCVHAAEYFCASDELNTHDIVVIIVEIFS